MTFHGFGLAGLGFFDYPADCCWEHYPMIVRCISKKFEFFNSPLNKRTQEDSTIYAKAPRSSSSNDSDHIWRRSVAHRLDIVGGVRVSWTDAPSGGLDDYRS